MTPLKNNLDK